MIEREIDGARAMFVNTTEANVIPVTSPNLDALDPRGYRRGSATDAETIGRRIADEVLQVLANIVTTSQVQVGSARRVMRLQPNNAAFDLETAQPGCSLMPWVTTSRSVPVLICGRWHHTTSSRATVPRRRCAVS